MVLLRHRTLWRAQFCASRGSKLDWTALFGFLALFLVLPLLIFSLPVSVCTPKLAARITGKTISDNRFYSKGRLRGEVNKAQFRWWGGMEAIDIAPQEQTLVSFIAAIGAKRGVRMMRAIRAVDEEPRLRDPFASAASEYELRLLMNEDELHGAAMMYEYLHPEDDPLVEGRHNGVKVLNAYRRAMRAKLLPSAFNTYFRDAFAEANSIIELRKNLNAHALAGARYVFDYFCPEECLPNTTECEDEDAAQSRRRFSLRASLLNETDLALGWVTLLEFAAMRLVLRWSEIPSILRDGEDVDIQGDDPEQLEDAENEDEDGEDEGEEDAERENC